jgi:formate-dependent nitrite reductase membrane component NrfD
MTLEESPGREEAARSQAGDGRNIDPGIGILEGEGADQAVPRRREAAEGAVPYEVWEQLPSRPDGEVTYYDRPAIKEPVWIWAVPAYFYAGGVAGASAVLGAAVQVAGGEDLRELAVRCRRVAAVAGAVGTGLLIYDLGRPARFLNMLRVFRPSSPMSVGSWVLAAAGPLTAGSALLAHRRGLLRRLGDLAGVGAGVVGMPQVGYTAVLLSNTAVPLWQGTRRTLPALFTASAASSAASFLELLDLSDAEERVVHRFGLGGKVAEMAAMAAVEREAATVEEVARPLREGVSGAMWKAARGLTAASLIVSLIPGRRRGKRVLSGLLGTAGSLAVRFAVFHAGKASARDPRATFRQQRGGHGAAEVAGRAAVTGPSGRRAV